MDSLLKPYVHLPIDAVDAVIFDAEGRYDSERYDRYATFTAARDAALSSIEIMLDEGDYDDEEHREELERMLGPLETSETFEQLEGHSAYRRLVARLDLERSAAA
jgi:hypothetical protein